jgi:Uma2 family endonuclease
MKTREDKPIAKEPSYSYGGKYTYADYLSWEMDEMVEIIKGKMFKWTEAPSRLHQKVAGELGARFNGFLKGKTCEVYNAPFDVRLPEKSKKDQDIYTVVQPDISVICDRSKLDDAGCIGAPDLIVEILSPSNNRKELKHKYEVYLESGIKEYWVLQPIGQTLLIYTLANDKYIPSKLYCPGYVVKSTVLEGFELDLEEFFRDMD